MANGGEMRYNKHCGFFRDELFEGETTMKKAFPLFVLTLYCIFCMVMTPTQASAYIDPSTTTFIIQAGIGLVVAIAAGFSIYWRKAKKKINKAVGREEVTKDESDNLEDL